MIETDFLEYLKEMFRRWQQYYEKGITLGTREIAKLQERIIGAKLNSHIGFEVIAHHGADNEGQECFALTIYESRGVAKNESPLYRFTTRIYR